MERCSRCKQKIDFLDTVYRSVMAIWDDKCEKANYSFCQDCTEALKNFFMQSDIDSDIDCSLFNKSEVHNNCTVEIWENSVTGKMSVGWYDNER